MTLATGIGSHPGDDDRAYAEAVRVVLGELVPPTGLAYVPEMPGRGAPAGPHRQERQVQLAQHQPERLVEVALLGPREGADPGR